MDSQDELGRKGLFREEVKYQAVGGEWSSPSNEMQMKKLVEKYYKMAAEWNGSPEMNKASMDVLITTCDQLIGLQQSITAKRLEKAHHRCMEVYCSA